MKQIIDPYPGVTARPHPAKFSDSILEAMADMIPEDVQTIVDPMAGVGKVLHLASEKRPFNFICNELESEWAVQITQRAAQNKTTAGTYRVDVHVGDAATWRDERIGHAGSMVVTSPPYGNRMADAFRSESRPESMKGRYAGELGRRLTGGSLASLGFGPAYESTAEAVFANIFRQMHKGQHFLLNVSNFIRKGEEVDVAKYYAALFNKYGFVCVGSREVKTPRARGFGANSNARAPFEVLLLWRKHPIDGVSAE